MKAPALLIALVLFVSNAAAATKALWLKADALALANNDPVATWTDSSASANNAAQATAGKRPLFKTNVVNGQPAIRFDGADDYLKLATALSPSNVDVIIVFAPTAAVTTASDMCLLGAESSASGDGTIFLGNISSSKFTNEIVSFTRAEPGVVYGSANTDALSGWHIFIFRLNANGTDIRRDGASLTLVDSSDGPLTPAGKPFVNVNAIGTLGGASPLAGDIAEIQVYNSELTGAEAKTELASLATKYGITLGSTTAADTTYPSVATAYANAFDGDTVTIPSGTSSWTLPLKIYKEITLRGNTTVNPSAGTANDLTIIQDDIINTNSPVIQLNGRLTGVPRLTGITFVAGARGNANDGAVNVYGEHGSQARVDNCHFNDLARTVSLYVGGPVFGVDDHCLFETTTTSNTSILVRMPGWNGDTEGTGDKSLADFPYYGTNKFWFTEDCYFKNGTIANPLSNFTDGDFGSRFVVRHCQLYDTQLQGHGSEGRYRKGRCVEYYSNDFHFTRAADGLGGMRGYTGLIHDNSIVGTQPTSWLSMNDLTVQCIYNPFRTGSGVSDWDVNVTESNGTHVDGHASYLFASGTAQSGSQSGLVAQGSPGWTVGQWIGYRAVRISDGGYAVITNNDAGSLTLNNSGLQAGTPRNPVWANGDQFQIYGCPLKCFDQTGYAQGHWVTAGYGSGGTVHDTVTSGQNWTDEVLEPLYDWNNTYEGTPTGLIQPTGGTDPAQNLWQSGRDYFNGSSSAAAIAKYVAALNGVDYTGPYTYPHPLQGGAPASFGTRKIGRGHTGGAPALAR